MTISVIASASAMADIVNAPAGEREDRVRTLWAPLAGMYHFVPGGVDLAAVHRQGFGFDWDKPSDQLRAALAALENADVWSRASTALETCVTRLADANPGITIPDLTVLIVLGDPTNDHFLTEVQGLSAFGGISGFIVLTLWPHPVVLDRIEAIVAHELHHNIRYSPGGVVWEPATVTVGEQIVAEGLADVFATEVYGDAGHTHFVAESTRTDPDVLRRIVTGLNVTGMQNFAAWVLGDASAQLLGSAPVGLPTGAGYAAGVNLVTASLAATGHTAAEAVATPSSTILSHALPLLGLSEPHRA